MSIIEQVCTLEQSKIFKELGVNNSSYFYWHFGINKWIIIDTEHSHVNFLEDYPAFTVTELGKMIGNGTGSSISYWQWVTDCVNAGLSGTFCYNPVALAGFVITQLQIGILDVQQANKRLKTLTNNG